MKVPPKRKGNQQHHDHPQHPRRLNESPSQKEGKSECERGSTYMLAGLNESPSQKEGKSTPLYPALTSWTRLNESPSQKEGKYLSLQNPPPFAKASMKVPPKRKGNEGKHKVTRLPLQGPQ